MPVASLEPSWLPWLADWASLLGLLLSLVILVLTWATRRKIQDVQEDVLKKVSIIYYHEYLRETVQNLRACHDFCNQIRFDLAADRCGQARQKLAYLMESGGWLKPELDLFRRTMDDLRLIKTQLARKRKNKPLAIMADLEKATEELAAIQARVFKSITAVFHGKG